MLGTSIPSISQWYKWLWEDLQPTPGRLASSVRVVVAVLLALILLLALQIPFVSLPLYTIFIVGRESPTISLRSSVLALVITCVAILISLVLVVGTDNNPLIRLLSVAVVTFVAGLLTQASTLAPLAPTLGFLYVTVIALWENHSSPDRTVKTSLFLLGGTALAQGCAILVEYLFASRSAVARLREQIAVRYKALETMFRACAVAAPSDDLSAAYTQVERLAWAGQRDMQALYHAIVQRNLNPKDLPVGMRVRITMLAELVDVSAAFGATHLTNADLQLRQRCEWVADRCGELGKTFESGQNLSRNLRSDVPALRLVEETLEAIMAMPVRTGDSSDERLIFLPANKVPFFVPGALKAISTLAFGLKISFCATLCYILYHALDYPQISTAVTTVLVSGLTTTGAMKQKLAHRLAGAIIGGLILGLGSIVFLFPQMDSITALCALVAPITFVAAWNAAGRKFGYVGLQIAFSFFTVTLATSKAPMELAPARDRLVGIVLALIIMWFVFDQIWPVRTISTMRQALASVLRQEAQMLSVNATQVQSSDLSSRIDGLRHHVSAGIAEIRNLREALLYEFGVNHEAHKAAGETVLRAALASGSLFWNELAVLERNQNRDPATHEKMLKIRETLAKKLETIADAVVERKPIIPLRETPLDTGSFPPDSREAQYANIIVARYREVESILFDLPS